MVDQTTGSSNVDDFVTNTPTFSQKPAEGVDSINRRLAQISSDIKNISRPPLISAGNLIALLTAISVLALAAFGAWGISGRIDHVNDHIDRVEDRIISKLDKLSDQFSKMDERTSTIEGRLLGEPAAQPGAKPPRRP